MDCEPAQQTPSQSKTRANKPSAFLTFCDARSNGQSIGLSARAAGVSRNTGTRYESLRIEAVEQENRLLDAKGRIASRNQTAEKLSAAMEDCPPQYLAGIATSLSKVMGYEAPTRSQIEVRAIPASVNAWLEGLGTVDTQPTRMIESNQHDVIDAEVDPPKALSPKPSG
jgi:hypothetical protein